MNKFNYKILFKFIYEYFEYKQIMVTKMDF